MTPLGFDFSRNLASNVEVHGEVTHVPANLTAVLESTGTIVQGEQPATSLVMGLRYLTEANTTYIVDYFRNGAGYAPGRWKRTSISSTADTMPGPLAAMRER